MEDRGIEKSGTEGKRGKLRGNKGNKMRTKEKSGVIQF